MDQTEVFDRVVKILTPYVKNHEALEGASLATHILDDLKLLEDGPYCLLP